MFVEHPVHEALRPFITRMVGYDLRMGAEEVHHGIPSPSTTVIVSFDAPLDVEWHGAPDTSVQHWTLASGLHLGPSLVRTHGHQHGIQLDLTPNGCRALLGLPVGGISGELAAHEDLPGGVSTGLHGRIADEPHWQERFAILEEHLLRLAHAGRASPGVEPAVAQAWSLLAARRGRIGVAELADHVSCSRRHLLNRFRTELGRSPGEVARLHRFGHAATLGRQGLPWAEIAARCGYADQAHLSREFRNFTTLTATQWRAEVFPIVQDSGLVTA